MFMPFVLEGEDVLATVIDEKPGFARARVEKILQPSARRIAPPCAYFQRCGGCHYQHSSYEHQLEIKVAILKENLRRIAKLELSSEVVVHPSVPWNYRNRSQLKVRTEPEFALGYFKFNSHELLPVENCPISSPLINRAIAALWHWGQVGKDQVALTEVEFFVNADDSELLVELSCAPGVPAVRAQATADSVRQMLPQIIGVVVFPQSTKAGQRTAEPEPLAVSGASGLLYRTERAEYRVSRASFFQVNRALVDELVGLVAARGSGNVALDLYAGAGLFSSVLAGRFAQVIAVEASQISHQDLRQNSPANVKAVRATTQQYLQRLGGKLRPDLVVADPPRSGLGAVTVKQLLALRAPEFTYVSCDPATLARDLSGLLAGGYRVEQAHLVDLFPQTYHLESVFHLVR